MAKLLDICVGDKCLSNKTTAAFRAKLVAVANRLGVDPDHLASAMAFETGGNFSPSIKNSASGATGLIQFMPSTARDMFGITTADLAKMSAEQQLDYVEKYFNKIKQRYPSLPRLEDVYLAIFTPAFIGKSTSAVAYSAGSAGYSQNKGFDATGKGYFTVGEITAPVRSLYTKAQQRPALEVQAFDLMRVLTLLSAGLAMGYAVAWLQDPKRKAA